MNSNNKQKEKRTLTPKIVIGIEFSATISFPSVSSFDDEKKNFVNDRKNMRTCKHTACMKCMKAERELLFVSVRNH